MKFQGFSSFLMRAVWTIDVPEISSPCGCDQTTCLAAAVRTMDASRVQPGSGGTDLAPLRGERITEGKEVMPSMISKE